MNPTKIGKTRRDGPEAIIQRAIIAMLEDQEWAVMSTHGNIYQFGFPDLYAMHYTRGTRWIEVKNPEGYSFTPAQMKMFPIFASKGVGIWILTAATEYEYEKLMQPCNWYHFIGKSKVTP